MKVAPNLVSGLACFFLTANVFVAATCVVRDVALVKKGATDVSNFCRFYNARYVPCWKCIFPELTRYRKRQLSPFDGLTALQTMAACSCILESSTTVPSPVAPLPQPVSSGTNASCYGYDMNVVKSSFDNAHRFCAFFNSFSK